MLIKNGYVYADKKIVKSEVATDGATIAYVGENAARFNKDGKTFDLKGGLLIPSFKNMHTHSAMTFLRGRAENQTLEKWLFDTVFPQEEKLDYETVYYGCLLAFAEYVRGGTTACADMYMFPEAFVDACKDSGFRGTVIGSVSEKPTDEIAKYLERCEDMTRGTDARFFPGVHAIYTNTKESIKVVSDFAKKTGKPCFTHLCETKKEVEDCVEKYGVTPPKLFDELGFFDNGGGAYHFVHPSEADIALLKARNVAVITCPCSNAKLSSGVATVDKYIKNGMTVGYGTDGAASNNGLSMIREMYLSVVLQKLNFGADAMDATTAFECATRDFTESDSGKIQAGARADFAVVDLDAPCMNPDFDPIASLVLAADNAVIKATIGGGKVLYNDGNYYLGIDTERVRESLNRLVKR